MPQIVQQYVAEKRVSDSFRERLERWYALAPEYVLHLLELAPSANTLGQMLQLVDEIAARDERSFSDVLNDARVAEVCLQEGLSRKEKQKLLRKSLEALRFPELRKIRDSLVTHTEAIRKDVGLRLALPEDLEGDAIELVVSFRSLEECQMIAERLSRVAAHPSTEQLLNILNGKD